MKAAASCTCLAVIASWGGSRGVPCAGLLPSAGGRSGSPRGGGLRSLPGMPIATGVAAPSVVAGAMAATCAAYRM